MVLPTRVDVINDSSQRFKVKIDNDKDRKYDEIINIEPGSRLDGIEGSVSGSGRFDVIIDIITNPNGPDNNTRLGGFKFDNPTFESPQVSSDEFTCLNYVTDNKVVLQDGESKYHHYLSSLTVRVNDPYKRKRYWGKLDSGLLDQQKSFVPNRAVLVNAAPKPTFTIESFFNDDEAGAKVWDLRINGDNFTL